MLTNQSGLGRGYFDRATLDAIHGRLTALLANDGVTLSAFTFVLTRPTMVAIVENPNSDLPSSPQRSCISIPRILVVGDKACDVELGRASRRDHLSCPHRLMAGLPSPRDCATITSLTMSPPRASFARWLMVLAKPRSSPILSSSANE